MEVPTAQDHDRRARGIGLGDVDLRCNAGQAGIAGFASRPKLCTLHTASTVSCEPSADGAKRSGSRCTKPGTLTEWRKRPCSRAASTSPCVMH
eukprot:6151053-Pyramimonas_sp.AAC.1